MVKGKQIIKAFTIIRFNKKQLRLFIIFNIILALILIIIATNNNNKAKKESKSIQFNGIVYELSYLKNKKPLFVLIGNKWYAIMHYPFEQHIEKGDSIYKRKNSDCIFVKKYSTHKIKSFCKSSTFLVKDKIVLKKLKTIAKQ